MKRLFSLVSIAGFVSLALGCTGEKDKGINSNRDKPKAAKMRIEEVNRPA